ncbi:oxidoreductase [Streptomyces spinoverrucosus]|uniref:Oxidoreductase n=1 Tax=Streptomyces spinoverrucosus TaxID=284043 RepID=A0A4Y3VRF9_9ACTN|nr:acyl-CoA dehydrogenase [Streptomyces spinoverrucosus]GEC08300.1 oxidoreductase [Streptomyces spinoverrucosus]GHB88388.1 oxidoreductase [Streptomyces spinoverrucosus]
MRFLDRERAALTRLLPGLDDSLRAVPLMTLEGPDSPGIGLFRKSGGPGLLAPASLQGRGASALEAVRVQRALGSRSPSLAVATTMHHFSMATLVGLSGAGEGLEWMLVQAVASDDLLMASGFAEGRSGHGILSPTMTATPTPEGLRVSGVKRPCSLARSMDLLTASVLVPRADGAGDELAVALIPADSEGLTVSGFWSSRFLAGAESEQVTLDGVLVPPDLLVRTACPPGERLDAVQRLGLVWFELLMTGSYLGAASALVERVLLNDRVPESERVALLVAVESAAASVEGLARRVDQGVSGGASADGASADGFPSDRASADRSSSDGFPSDGASADGVSSDRSASGSSMPEHTPLDDSALAESLFVRYGVQDALARIVPRAVELLGGLNFMSSDEIGHLATCTHGLALHPPSRSRMTGPLAAYLAGDPLTVA